MSPDARTSCKDVRAHEAFSRSETTAATTASWRGVNGHLEEDVTSLLISAQADGTDPVPESDLDIKKKKLIFFGFSSSTEDKSHRWHVLGHVWDYLAMHISITHSFSNLTIASSICVYIFSAERIPHWEGRRAAGQEMSGRSTSCPTMQPSSRS